MILGSEYLGALNTMLGFRQEADRKLRFASIAASRAKSSGQDSKPEAVPQTSGCNSDAGSPGDFKLKTFEVSHTSKTREFSSLVEPLCPEEFFTRQYQQRAHMLFRGPADRFSHLIGWDDLTVMLRSGNFQSNQISIVLAEHGTRDTDYLQNVQSASGIIEPRREKLRKFDEYKLNFLLRNGASLIINSVGEFHSKLNRFIASISDSVGAYTSANLYVSWRDTQAFPTHWDDHDVYILQVYGSKIWNLYGETRQAPLPWDAEPNVEIPKEAKWTGRLEAGDVLFIPRGSWHDAIVPKDCAGQGSMHLTLSFKEHYSLDVMEWLQYRLVNNWDRARINLPRNAKPDATDKYFQELRQAVLDVLDDGPAREYDDYIRANWRDETNLQIGPWIEPWTDPQWSGYRLTLRGFQQARIALNEQQGTFMLTANRRLFTFDIRCLDVIQHLLDNGGRTVEELRTFDPERFEQKFMDQFLVQLVKQDVVLAELP